jgi:nitrogen regulatory protein PII
MHFKLIIAFVEDGKTNKVIESARAAGATGVTVISNARGEGPECSRSFFGLSLESQRDMLLFIVEEHLCRHILELIGEVGKFDASSGAGVAFQIDVEDAIGLTRQVEMLADAVEEAL